MTGAAPPWRALPDGVSLAVKVQPGARRAAILGQVPDKAGTRLRIAVAEPPEKGRANRAVCVALAHALGVKPGQVALRAGAASRQKTIHVAGESGGLLARLDALFPPP